MIKYILRQLDHWTEKFNLISFSDQKTDRKLKGLILFKEDVVLPEVETVSFRLLQERYRELTMKFVNYYGRLEEEEYRKLDTELRKLRAVIHEHQPRVGE